MFSTFLTIHVIAGSIGILSGAAALIFRKGARYHRKAGNVFFISMLIMGATAAGLAVYVTKPLSVIGGVLAFYLVATSWATVIRKEGETGVFEIGAILAALATAAFAYYVGMEVLGSETGIYEGSSSSPGPYFFFGSFALLGAILDAKVVWSGGVSGKQRIVRHLWRMCFALFMATASFFLGQPQIFPEAIRGTFILTVPVLLVIAAMFFWVIRVQFTNWYKPS